MWNQEKYLQAWNFASHAHKNQLMPGTGLPYSNHIGSVAMEVMAAVACCGDSSHPTLLVQCAVFTSTLTKSEPLMLR